MKPQLSGPAALIVLLVITVFAVLGGCSKPAPETYELDLTPVLSGGLGWAVISGAYVRLKVEPRFGARDGDYSRRGDILRVVATERAFSGRDRGNWYRLEGDEASGWLHQSLLTVYPSLERAKRAAKNAAQTPTQTRETGQ